MKTTLPQKLRQPHQKDEDDHTKIKTTLPKKLKEPHSKYHFSKAPQTRKIAIGPWFCAVCNSLLVLYFCYVFGFRTLKQK
jgi:hypothetical protein